MKVLATYSTETHHAIGSRVKTTLGNGGGGGGIGSWKSIIKYTTALHCTVKP